MSEQFVTMLALERHATLTTGQIVKHIQHMYRDVKEPLLELAGGDAPLAQAKESLMFEYGGVPFTVMFMDAPIPEGSLDQAIMVNRMWPEAKEQLARHTAHVIIAPLTKSDDFQVALRLASLATYATAAISALLSSCLGIYWVLGDTVSEPEEFREYTRLMYREPKRYPLWQWMQFLPMQGEPAKDGTPQMAMVTTGLRPFVGRELEFMPSPMPVSQIGPRVMGIVGYLMLNGPVIKDGETLGLAENEQVHVVFADEGQAPGVPIMRLYVEVTEDA